MNHPVSQWPQNRSGVIDDVLYAIARRVSLILVLVRGYSSLITLSCQNRQPGPQALGQQVHSAGQEIPFQ